MSLDFGDAHILIFLGVVIDFFQGVVVLVGFELGAILVSCKGFDLIFVLGLLALAAPAHGFKMIIISYLNNPHLYDINTFSNSITTPLSTFTPSLYYNYTPGQLVNPMDGILRLWYY